MGYRKIITFILESEMGTSLKASGWECESSKCGGLDWTNNNRARQRAEYQQITMFDKPKKEIPREYKQRWIKNLAKEQKNE